MITLAGVLAVNVLMSLSVWKSEAVTVKSMNNSEEGNTVLKPELDSAEKLLKSRILVLGGEVNDRSANLLVAQLLLLAEDDAEKDITLFINSPGGSVTAGMAVYDTMNFINCDVRTVGIGLAASMGQLLLCAGAKGKRYALPNARIMMHQPLGGVGGSASDIRIQAEQMSYTKKTLAEIIAKHSGQSLSKVQEDSERDNWFSSEEAAKYCLIDPDTCGHTHRELKAD